MKKVLLVLAVASAVAFTSCKKADTATEGTATDSVAVEAPVEEAVADTTVSDSTAVAADSTAK